MTTGELSHMTGSCYPTRALGQMQNFEDIVYPADSEISESTARVILVSIDLEFGPQANDIDQVGIATLPSAKLFQPGLDETRMVITSHCFLLRRDYIPRNTYTRQYLYGTAQRIPAADLSHTLAAIITPINQSKVVLVGHNIKADILAIKRYCGLDLQTLPHVLMTVDTQYVPSELFDLQYTRVTLKHACKLVGIHAKQLHNAGNDAYYTLRVWLLLFHIHKRREIQQHNSDVTDTASLTWRHRLDILERIGKNSTKVPRPPKKIRTRESRHHDQSYDEQDCILGLAALAEFDDV